MGFECYDAVLVPRLVFEIEMCVNCGGSLTQVEENSKEILQ
jgi:hypothetical protein